MCHACASESDNDEEITSRSASSNKEQKKPTMKTEDKDKTLMKVPKVSIQSLLTIS
jgi:hypothetical protein